MDANLCVWVISLARNRVMSSSAMKARPSVSHRAPRDMASAMARHRAALAPILEKKTKKKS
jgi:hypothetical protein